jgi:hypothetical protein
MDTKEKDIEFALANLIEILEKYNLTLTYEIYENNN